VIETKPTFHRSAQVASPELSITVLYTGVRPTLAALRRAAVLARDLGATIRVLNVRAVPYPLPLDHPPVNSEVLATSFRTLVQGQPIPTRVEICYGRDIIDSIRQSLSPNSLVVIGARTRSWPTREQRWAKQLNRLGHQVIFVSDRQSNMNSNF
jgi:hypothetical protein